MRRCVQTLGLYCTYTYTITLEGKHIITYFECKDRKLCNIVNLFILLGKFHIHKATFSSSTPCFKLFQVESDMLYSESLKLVSNKKAILISDIICLSAPAVYIINNFLKSVSFVSFISLIRLLLLFLL